MNIPSRVNPFGYDNSIPPGYFRVEFLESTGTQRIDTGMPATNLTCTEVDFADVKNDNWAVPVAATGTNAYCIFAKGSIGVVSRVPRFDYGTSQVLASQYNVSSGRHTMRKEAERNFIDGVEVTSNAPTGSATWANIYLLYFNTLVAFMSCKLYSYKKWELGGPLQQHFIPAVNSAGVPCMCDSVTGNSHANHGIGSFIVGMNMEQAESFGSVIPPNTNLTVSFPWEAKLVQYNSRVEYSLEQARNKGCTISVQYRDPETDSVIYNKYAECETVADMVAVNPEYKTDLTIDGAWEYPLPKLRDADMAFKDSPIRKFSVTLPALVNGKQFFCGTALEGEMTIDLPSISKVGSSQMFVATTSNERKLTKLTINAKPGSAVHQIVNTWTVSDYYLEELNLTGFTASWYNGDAVAARHYALKRFRIDAVGCVAHWNGAFSHSILDKESILNIVRATIIPADPMVVSQNITSHFGFHVDHKTDPDVLAAISTLEEGGHKLSIRWNGTPTSGVSLMDLEEIWCKVVEKEDGEYLNENGIRCDIDWGHYVTDTSSYKLFFSLAEAEEYYKLVKVV